VERPSCFLKDEAPSLVARFEVIPFVFSSGYMLSQFRAPNFIADIHTVTPSIDAYEDESSVRMVFQIPVQPYALILVKGFNEIQEIPFILDPSLNVSWHQPRASLPPLTHNAHSSGDLMLPLFLFVRASI